MARAVRAKELLLEREVARTAGAEELLLMGELPGMDLAILVKMT